MDLAAPFQNMHAKRILSLTNATLGVIKTASLAVNTIGQGLALARGLVTKHAIRKLMSTPWRNGKFCSLSSERPTICPRSFELFS
jgi:hypothetical protein